MVKLCTLKFTKSVSTNQFLIFSNESYLVDCILLNLNLNLTPINISKVNETYYTFLRASCYDKVEIFFSCKIFI